MIFGTAETQKREARFRYTNGPQQPPNRNALPPWKWSRGGRAGGGRRARTLARAKAVTLKEIHFTSWAARASG